MKPADDVLPNLNCQLQFISLGSRSRQLVSRHLSLANMHQCYVQMYSGISCSTEPALSLKMVHRVTLARRCAFLFLAFAVFCLGLQARLVLYSANPPVQIAAAKLSTERHSAEALRSLEVRSDDLQPITQNVLAVLLSQVDDLLSPVPVQRTVAVALSDPIRSQLRCVTSLRRPPPSAI